MSDRARSRLLSSEIGMVERVAPHLDVPVLTGIALPLLDQYGRRGGYARAKSALARVGASECARQHWSELADSERALVALAHGIAREPKLLLVDDLAATLGIGEYADIAELLGALTAEREIAVLICTGDSGPRPNSDRVASLGAGELLTSAAAHRRCRADGQTSSTFRASVGVRLHSATLMLELRDLVKHYHMGDAGPVRAVDGVSLSIAAGELVALYGPSGSGKTTLLMLIAALIEPDSGTVLVDGRDLSALTDAERSHYRLCELGFVDQTSDLLPGGNVVQNAAMKLWMLEHTRDAEHRIEPLLIRLGLGDRLSHRADQLSMGERQRVMIARALSTEPQARARRRADGQPRHPPRTRSPGAARGGLPRAAARPYCSSPTTHRPPHSPIVSTRCETGASSSTSPTTSSRPPGRLRPPPSDAAVEHRPPVCGAAESAGRARPGAVRGARDRRRGGAAVRVADREHEP